MLTSLWVFLFIACTNSGLGQNLEDTDTATGTTDGTTGGVEKCKWEGTYELSEFRCNTIELGDFKDLIDTTTLAMSQNEVGGCDVTFTWANGECQETEVWLMDGVTENTVSVWQQGITSCEPEACTFEEGDAVCATGERTGTTTIPWEVLDPETGGVSEESLVFTNLLLLHNTDCQGVDQKTLWVKR